MDKTVGKNVLGYRECVIWNAGKDWRFMAKKIFLAVVGFFLMLLAAAAFREAVWRGFDLPRAEGSIVKSNTYDPRGLSETWFKEYFDRLKGGRVPYDHRVVSARIDQVEVLDELEEPYIQLDYTVHTASANTGLISSLELASTDKRSTYTGQMVLKWTKADEHTYILAEKLRPVQYQIMTPKFQQEINTPQTEHYKLNTDEPMTYYIEDEVLYVTYDSGENFVKVPNGYELVCERGGIYTELLDDNSYIVSEEFTGFIAGRSLLYSLDMGKTWQISEVYERGYAGNGFLSKTEKGYYVTIAADRSLGSDYYLTYWSEDLVQWTPVEMPDAIWTNLTCVFWSDAGLGYYAKGTDFYMTSDNGATYEQIFFPEAVEITEGLGFNPFDTVEKMYEKDEILYVVVGQGDDGDYLKDGKLMEALYESQDGHTFTFVKEIADDTPEEAG